MAKLRDGETMMSLAVSRSDSLRTTVPLHIARKLGLRQKDRVVWDLDKVGDEWIATIRKAQAPA